MPASQQAKPGKKSKQTLLIQTVKTQFPMVLAIVLSDILLRFRAESGSVVIIALLCAMIYVAQSKGIRQGLISAALVVLFDYYIIASTVEGPWLTPETLRRGAVIAFSFPLLAFVIGRLKERNDGLLRQERVARKYAEASERRLRFMAESMPQKIFTSDPNGKTEYFNPQWEEYMGNPPGLITSDNWSELIHPDDIHENAEHWQHSLDTGEPFQFEHRLKRNDGEYIWHITRANAVRDEEGQITGWIGSSTDIEDVRKTRRLEASTAKLIKQRTQLMELNTAKDEFISLASHQLRTPATGVKQYLNMALDGYGGKVPPRLRVFLEKANESNERQLAVINDLLQVAQMDAGKVVLRKEEVDVSKLIADIVREQRSKFSLRKQTVTFKKSKVKLRVHADATKLRMVIENVIDNASKYTPTGKKITIQVTQSRGMAHIAIKDEGVGIAAKDIKKVFQKFTRLDNPMSTEVGGTGLGLYWVQKVIELHDGSISVDSKVNNGSTFTISLPLS
jgi:PAS domain S-box-containing protein